MSKRRGSMNTKAIPVFKDPDAAESMSTIHDKYDVVSSAKINPTISWNIAESGIKHNKSNQII